MTAKKPPNLKLVVTDSIAEGANPPRPLADHGSNMWRAIVAEYARSTTWLAERC